MRTLGIALAVATAALATPIPFSGWASVGGDSHYLCIAENGCLGGDFGRFGFSDNGPGGLAYPTLSLGGDTFDLSYNFLVGYTDFDVTASNGLITARHHPDHYDNPDYGELGAASGHILWTAQPIEIKPNGPWGYHSMTVDLPVVVSGHVKAWTAEEWASGEAPFFDYQITGTGTLKAGFADSPFFWYGGNVTLSGTAEPVPEPATWVLAFGLVLLMVRRSRARA